MLNPGRSGSAGTHRRCHVPAARRQQLPGLALAAGGKCRPRSISSAAVQRALRRDTRCTEGSAGHAPDAAGLRHAVGCKWPAA